MSKIVDILASYISFSRGDEQALDIFFNRLATDQLTMGRTIVGASGSGGVSVKNVKIGETDGVTLYNPNTGARSIYLDPDGDAWFGKNTEVPGSTALSIFSNAQTYNGENFGEGDMMVGDNSTSKANLLWDQSTGQLKLRSGTTAGIILDTNGTLQSGNYSYNEAGWVIEPGGNAEFNTIVARGAIKTAVFEKGHVIATGGNIVVSKAAGELAESVQFPGSFPNSVTLVIKNTDDDLGIATAGDFLYLRGWDPILEQYNEANVIVSSVTDNLDGTSDYLCSLTGAGPIFNWFHAGQGVSNLGQMGDGFITIEAGAVTRFTIEENSDTTLGAGELRMVLGDLYNTFGAGINHYIGIGIGDYAGGNYLVYNADGAGTFQMKAGDGNLTIGETGIIIDDNDSTIRELRWRYDTAGANDYIGGIYGDYGGGADSGVTVRAYRQSGDSWTNAVVVLRANDTVNSKEGILQLSTNGSGTPWMKLFASDMEITAGDLYLAAGGLAVGSALGGTNPASGEIITTGNVTVGKTLHVTGVSVPSSGVGLELYWNGSASRILSYSRTGTTYQPLDFISSKFQFLEETTAVITIDNGDIWTQDFTNYSGSTTVGWSSLSTKKIYYKTIGDWVFIQFELYGTANNATTTFTVPYSNNGSIQAEGVMRCDDVGGAASFGMCILPLSSSTVTLYRDPALTAWSTTGTKWASGQFWYQRA